MLGNGGAALEFVVEESVFGRSSNALDGEAKVAVEAFVFDGDGGLPDMIRERVEADGSAVAVGVDLVELLAVSVGNNSGDRVGRTGKAGGSRDVFEKPNDDCEHDDDEDQTDADGDFREFFGSFGESFFEGFVFFVGWKFFLHLSV